MNVLYIGGKGTAKSYYIALIPKKFFYILQEVDEQKSKYHIIEIIGKEVKISCDKNLWWKYFKQVKILKRNVKIKKLLRKLFFIRYNQ